LACREAFPQPASEIIAAPTRVAVFSAAVYGCRRVAARGLRPTEDFMPNIGFSELLVILLILILVFGASRLPALGEGLGKAIRGFKRSFSQDEKIEVTPVAPKRVTDASEHVSDAEIVDDSKSTTPR
jgi:sec-independent protein translocase protein TatA